MTRAYGGLVAGLAMMALASAGARLEPVEDDFGSRKPRTSGPDPTPEPEPVAEKVREVVVPPNDGEGIPDRLSIQRDSPYYTPVGGYVGVLLDGEDVNGRVVEFCTSGGWARLVEPSLSGKALGRLEVKGATRHSGVVQTYWRMQPSRQIRRQLARIA